MAERGRDGGRPGHIPVLDGVRALAAAAVLVYHVAVHSGAALQPGPFAALLARTDIGVALFFALSGLLLYRPWAAATVRRRPGRPPTGPYLIRRGLRILPAYWVLLAVTLVLYSRNHIADLATWLEMGLLVQNYDPSPWWAGTGSGPVGLVHAWSLCVEATFYLALPLTAYGLDRWAGRGATAGKRVGRLLVGVASLAAVSYGWTVLLFHPTYRPEIYHYMPRYLTYFAAGMALAVLVAWAGMRSDGASGRRLARRLARGWRYWWLGAAVLYAVAATPVTGGRLAPFRGMPDALTEQVIYTAVVACLLVPLALGPDTDTPIHRALSSRVASYLGQISYGVFLWQFVALFTWYELTDQRPWTGHFWFNLAGTTTLTLPPAIASYHLVERPALRVYQRARRAVPADSVTADAAR